MKKNREKVSFISALALICVLLNGLILHMEAEESPQLMDALGIVRFDKKIKAQSFTLKDTNGENMALEDFHGKIVLLNFWASWCLPCLIELPSMEKLYGALKEKGFTILAINLRENAQDVQAFQEKVKLRFPILLDLDGRVGAAYGVWSLPTTYLVDREGYVIGGALGPRDWASREALELFNDLLNASLDF